MTVLLWKPRMATSISTFVLGFGHWIYELISMNSALDEMVKGFVPMILALGGEARIKTQDNETMIEIRFRSLHLSWHARDSDECFDYHTQSKVPPSQSEESYLKSQSEGWNLGGHPRLPYYRGLDKEYLSFNINHKCDLGESLSACRHKKLIKQEDRIFHNTAKNVQIKLDLMNTNIPHLTALMTSSSQTHPCNYKLREAYREIRAISGFLVVCNGVRFFLVVNLVDLSLQVMHR